MRRPSRTGGSRSPLARAIGLGSAKAGVADWWAERVSAIALVPLTIWVLASLIAHIGGGYAEAVTWLRSLHAMVLMILLLGALSHHAALGLQVVVEDYVHSGAKIAAIIAIRLGCYGVGVVGVLAVLKIALGPA